MKNIVYLIVVFTLLFSCKKEANYVTFSGEVTNMKTDSLVVFHPKINFTKVIKLNEDGTFNDTLKVENGLFSITDSRDVALLYLINGDNIVMNFDGEKLLETLSFSGSYAKENNFLKTSIINENKLFSDTEFMHLSKKDFKTKVDSYVSDFNSRLEVQNLDVDFSNYQKKEIINFKEYLEKDYLKKNYNKLLLAKGKPSPTFDNYENFKGGFSSLKDFKGKYVYIDIWATWCHPCTQEIPFLKKLEKQFHNKNIEFVSISLDDKKGYEPWKSMVLNKELGGVQLYANGDQKFVSAYKVRSIPRFILLDPAGNVIDANAPRPSSAQLTVLLNSLPL